MTKITIILSDETHGSLKIRLAEETLKNKKKDKNAHIVTAQKFITDLIEKELKIKK